MMRYNSRIADVEQKLTTLCKNIDVNDRQRIYEHSLSNYKNFTIQRGVRGPTRQILIYVCYYHAISYIMSDYTSHQFCRNHELKYNVFCKTYRLFKEIISDPFDIKEPEEY